MELELVSKTESEKPSGDQPLADGALKYTGPERRKDARRITVDRREMVRFESNTDRRARGDRRGELKLWDGRNF